MNTTAATAAAATAQLYLIRQIWPSNPISMQSPVVE
jgi:hypothetical protein